MFLLNESIVKRMKSLKIIHFSENTLYHVYGVNSNDSKLLDGDKNTSEENDDPEPATLVQLKNSTTIKQLYVHLELGRLAFFHRSRILKKKTTMIITLRTIKTAKKMYVQTRTSFLFIVCHNCSIFK